MSGVYGYSTTAASNTSAGGVSTAEGMNPGLVNNAMRGIMAEIAEFRNDISGSATTGGSANAQTLTTSSTVTAYSDGQKFSFVAGYTNTGATTLNVDSVGAKAIRKADDQALIGNEIKAGGHYVVQYDASANSAAGAWLLLNPEPIELFDTFYTIGASEITNFWGAGDNRAAMWTPYGYIGSSGGFGFSIGSNGYRNDGSSWSYLDIDSNTNTSSEITLLPTGNIVFRGGTASGTALPDMLLLDKTQGAFFYGNFTATSVYTNTTASAANVQVASNGLVRRSTSALKYKTDLQPVSADAVEAFMSMEGFTYRSAIKTDDQNVRHYGFAADHAHDKGLTELVLYGADGETVEGFAYDRALVLLQKEVKRLRDEVEALKAA